MSVARFGPTHRRDLKEPLLNEAHRLFKPFASPLWAGLTMAVTVPVLFAAVLGALFRLGQARAFWSGIAVCGWGLAR